jgi:hypothetical protein
MVEGAQLSNSFIILMALSESKEPLNTTQISQIIALNSGGQIYKISATLKDSLEHRLVWLTSEGGHIVVNSPSDTGQMPSPYVGNKKLISLAFQSFIK